MKCSVLNRLLCLSLDKAKSAEVRFGTSREVCRRPLQVAALSAQTKKKHMLTRGIQLHSFCLCRWLLGAVYAPNSDAAKVVVHAATDPWQPPRVSANGKEDRSRFRVRLLSA